MQKEFKNPFSKIRAEQMGDSAWKYFVEPSKDYIGAKPLIFEGSRGTGKTMFFKCNSWKEKLQEALASNLTLRQFVECTKHIGFYYKADSRFVKSLDKKNVDDNVWIGIFNTYFNIVLSKEILLFVSILINENLIEFSSLQTSIRGVCLRLKKDVVSELSDLENILEEELIRIEQFANNTNEPQPVGLNAGTLIEQLLLGLKRTDLFANTTFHIFIDEFENFDLRQQIEINTLLKQSNNNIVYDYGVITKGIQTFLTTMGQELRLKDDFSLYSTDRYGYYESNEYNSLLKEICKKRLKEELDSVFESYDENLLDIAYYLKSYGKKYEEKSFETSPGFSKIKDRLLAEIKNNCRLFNIDESEIDTIYTSLTNCGAIQTRMHLALLMRRNPPVSAKELLRHKINNTSTYSDWLHNTESAIIYLLCKELKIEKKYHGFNVFSALSSGVIRSFLELAEYAFDYAMHSNTSLGVLRPFTIEEQTKAVYFVSKLKLNEIDSYEPFGFKLKSFTISLGKIFNTIQTNPNATLGEVEQNHFETKANDLKKHNPEANELLKYAIRYKILEEEDSTKTKSDEILEFSDYHLNHLYCPAFKISHLRKRKISISHTDLSKLFCGSHKELEEVVKKLSGSSDDNIPNLFSHVK